MPEFNEGDLVIYRPGRAFNNSSERDERGVVVLPAGHSKPTANGGHVVAGPRYTFVRYGNDEQAKATATEDLVLENAAPESVTVHSTPAEPREIVWFADESPMMFPAPADDEAYVNAIAPTITTVVGEVGFHIDAQARNTLRQAYNAGQARAEERLRGVPVEDPAPSFDRWIEEYIEDHERITSE